MKLLLHTCCAPCSVKCIETLRDEGTEPVLFWYNPNIHPYSEYRTRRETLVQYAKDIAIELIIKDYYGLREFVGNAYPDFDARCSMCYEMRLRETARYAAENGFDSISTTLLISPYQNHELICETAERLAGEYNVSFLYRDFRPHFREGQQKARELELYMQKYCGCIFSEEDRYYDRILKDKKKYCGQTQ